MSSDFRTARGRLPRSRLSSSRPPRLWLPYGPSHAIGYADPRPAVHSTGFGAYEEDGEVQSSSSLITESKLDAMIPRRLKCESFGQQGEGSRRWTTPTLP
jgi:hypothetical protein